MGREQSLPILSWWVNMILAIINVILVVYIIWTNKSKPDVSIEIKDDIYMQGTYHTWKLVQFALYDMFRSMELLDYHSMVDTLAKRLDVLQEDPDHLKEVQDAFNEEVYSQKDEE
jgi:hypothetical protein